MGSQTVKINKKIRKCQSKGYFISSSLVMDLDKKHSL